MISESLSLKVIYNIFTIVLSSIFTYLNINSETFMLFSLLLVIDFITGVWKARAINESITSNKMKYGVISKFSLVIIPFALAIGAKSLNADASSILYVGMNMLVLSEVYSIIGNIYAIRTKEQLPEYDVVAMIGKRIRRALLNYSGDKES